MDEGFKCINGIDLYYKSIGSGTPLVIIHGGPGFGHQYLYSYFSRLSDQYKIIFYDQRASGKSNGDENPSDVTMENFVEDLEGVRKAFQIEKLHILGQSYGGVIALSYAVKYPEQMGSLLLLESSTVDEESDRIFDNNLNTRLTEKESEKLADLLIRLEKTSSKARIMKEYFEILFRVYFYNEELRSQLDLTYLTNEMVQKIFITGDNLKARPNLFEYINQIDCPTLIIHGDYDPIPVEGMKKIHTIINNSQLTVLNDCGHFAHIEKTEKYFKRIRDFYREIL